MSNIIDDVRRAANLENTWTTDAQWGEYVDAATVIDHARLLAALEAAKKMRDEIEEHCRHKIGCRAGDLCDCGYTDLYDASAAFGAATKGKP